MHINWWWMNCLITTTLEQRVEKTSNQGWNEDKATISVVKSQLFSLGVANLPMFSNNLNVATNDYDMLGRGWWSRSRTVTENKTKPYKSSDSKHKTKYTYTIVMNHNTFLSCSFIYWQSFESILNCQHSNANRQLTSHNLMTFHLNIHQKHQQ